MPYMQMTEEQFKVPVLKNVIYALGLVWQTDKRLLIGYLLQEGLYAVFSRYLQNILFLKILLDVISHRVKGIEKRLRKIDRYLGKLGNY